MRPRLREDVRFAETPDGVYVQGDLGACTLRGPRAHAWLARLAPALTGQHELSELTAGLPPEKRAVVENLVRQLAAQRLVVDVATDRSHDLTEAELRCYAEEIDFIGYALDSPRWRFQRFRRARIALVGEGELLPAVLAAGLTSGWREVVVCTPEPATWPDPLVAAARRDPAQRVRLAGRDAAPAEADVVLQVAAQTGPLVEMARRCGADGRALGQMLVRGDEAWLAPVEVPGPAVAGSGWRRLSAAAGGVGEGGPGGGGAGPAGRWLTGPVPQVLAGQLVLSCFAHLTGLDELPDLPPASWGPRLTRVDLRTLDSRPHRFLPHPAEPPDPAGPGAATVARLETTPPVPAEAVLELAAAMVDPYTGVLGALDEGALGQVPLAVCRATVSDPHRRLPPPVPVEVTGWGADRERARVRTVLAALATYGTLAVGPGTTPDTPVWGLELAAATPRPVPARLAYPVLLDAALPYRAPVGAAAGLSWTGALAAGLRAHAAAVLRERLAAPAPAYPRVSPADLAGPGTAAAELAGLLAATGSELVVRDLTEVLDLPGYGCWLDGQPAALACAGSAGAALTDALERTLLAWQARTEGREGPGDPVRWGDGEADPAEVVRLTAGLRAAGWTPVAVPLVGDPELAALLPFLVQVVLLAPGGAGR